MAAKLGARPIVKQHMSDDAILIITYHSLLIMRILTGHMTGVWNCLLQLLLLPVVLPVLLP